jgi:hypothetical protein
MGLDVETPTPPDLTNRPLPSDLEPADVPDSGLRREELEEMLREGAWHEGFEEWAAYTDLTEAEYEAIRESGLLEELDFYWDPVEERVRFEVPPADRPAGEDLAERTTAEMTDLCRTVVEMLEDAYVDWEENGEALWSEETFGEGTPPEE